MKKEVWRKDRMKQIVNTGHKEFDRQLTCVSTGNVIGGGQYSFYIRPYSETACNGHTFNPGHLQYTDFGYFGNTTCRVPDHIRNYIRSIPELVILYNFHHHNTRYGKTTTVVHGWVLTNAKHRLIKYWVSGPTYKSALVIEGMLPYICED